MKNLAVAFSAAIFCLLISCNDKTSENEKAYGGGISEKAKKNLDNSTAIAKMFESGDFSKAGDYIAADGVDHSGPMGETKGLDSIKAMFTHYASMTTDAKNEIIKGLSDDDYSFMWLKQSWTGKVDDPAMGIKVGQKGEMESVEVCKHNAEGKITDHWSFASMADMMKMMPMPSTTTDTSKKK